MNKIKKVIAAKEDIANLRAEIASSKTDMIKWFFAFFMALALMIIGLYFKKWPLPNPVTSPYYRGSNTNPENRDKEIDITLN